MTISPTSYGMRNGYAGGLEHSSAGRMDMTDASSQFMRCFNGDGPSQYAPNPGGSQQSQDARELLGLVRPSNTPQQNVALIDAAVQFMVGQGGGRSSQSPVQQQNSQPVQMLGNIAGQVAGAPGVSDTSKNQILGGIAQILGQFIGQAQPQGRANEGYANGNGGAGQSTGSQMNQQLIQALGKLADQISEAPGMSDSLKNQILAEISQIIGQLGQANGGGAASQGAGGGQKADAGTQGAGDGQAQPGGKAADQLLGLVNAQNSPQANKALIDAAIEQMQQAGGQGGAQQSQLAQILGKIADQVAGAQGIPDATKNQILGEIGQILSQIGAGGSGAGGTNGAGASQGAGAGQEAGAGQGAGEGQSGETSPTQRLSQEAAQLLGMVSTSNTPQQNVALIDAAVQQLQQSGGQAGSQQAQALGKIADQVAGRQELPDATKNQILAQIAQALSQLQQGGGQAFGSSGSIQEAVSTLNQDVHSLLSGNPSLAATIEGQLSQVLAGVGGAE